MVGTVCLVLDAKLGYICQKASCKKWQVSVLHQNRNLRLPSIGENLFRLLTNPAKVRVHKTGDFPAYDLICKLRSAIGTKPDTYTHLSVFQVLCCVAKLVAKKKRIHHLR